jgi:hypothetical protein
VLEDPLAPRVPVLLPPLLFRPPLPVLPEGREPAPVPMPLELEAAPLERWRCMQSSRALPVRPLQADMSEPMPEELEPAAPVPP